MDALINWVVKKGYLKTKRYLRRDSHRSREKEKTRKNR